MIIVRINPTFAEWRIKARQLLSRNIHYEEVEWVTEENAFVFGEDWVDIETSFSLRVSKEFMDLAETVSCHRDPSTWFLLYKTLFRIVFSEPNLLSNPLDSDVMELHSRYRLVSRDAHKMKAFVRFKEVQEEDGLVYMAWHQPDHRIIRKVAPFFQERFQGMKWVIMTEDETMRWDGRELSFTKGVSREEAPSCDDKEDLWKTYYRAIFNPARIKINAMKKELPVRHWRTLPETELISGLLQEAPDRLESFYESQRMAPETNFSNLAELNLSLARCRACGICEKATAPVQGLGPDTAKIMVIGEQPGNEEDIAGEPFIGPAGQVLNEAINAVKLNRQDMYLTNAVKGFKYIPKAHMRWHKGASISEITTCKSWLKKEIEIVKPKLIVCLGRSAALSISGKMIKIEDTRGKFFKTGTHATGIILPHPASILRNKDDQKKAMEDFISEWKLIADVSSRDLV